MQAALEIRQRAAQHWSSMPGPVETSSGLDFGVFVSAIDARVIFRDRPLLFTQHIDPKTFLRMQMSMGARAVVHANQHQHGIKGYRRKGVRGHAMNFAFEVDGNDGDTGGEASHSL